MNSLSFEYMKSRKEFGKHPNFADNKPQLFSIGFDSVDENSAAQWVEKDETTVTLDCIPRYAEHEANTVKFVQQNMGVCHIDGAWPSEVKTSEFVDRQRYLRRITNDGGYQSAVMGLLKNAEVATQQNNTIDLFEDYFAKKDVEGEETVEYSSEPPSCRTVCVFRDPNEIKRTASHISWHPDMPNKMAVAYSILQFQQMPEKMPVNSYIWDVNNPNQPDAELHPQSPLVCVVYNPRSPDHLVGGCYNGLVAFWDLRKGSQPVESSILEKSHHDPAYNVFWIQSRTGNECCSVSTDGRLLWWDTRKLSEGPTDEMVLTSKEGNSYGGISMEYRSDAGATKYLVGTEQGEVVLVDRKASKDKGSQKSIKAVFGEKQGRHHGPVYSIERNPTNLKYFMTVGDWTARIWMEDQKAPILTTSYSNSYLTSACWSPTRPGVFFCTKKDGTLDVWDYYYKQNHPTFSTKVGDIGLSSMAVQAQGKLVAVGSEDGSTTVLELSAALSDIQPDEKAIIPVMLERETKREKNLEKRREAKARQMQKAKDAEGNDEGEVVFDPADKWDDKTAAAVAEAETAFFERLERIKADAKKEEEAADEAGDAEEAE